MHARELYGGDEVRVEIQNEAIAEKEFEEAIERSEKLVIP